jgi:CBS domain-containing protein
MTPNPVSIRDNATVEEAVAFLVDTGYSAAPVIDDAGRPVGVLSRTDIVVHDRERLALPASGPYYFEGEAQQAREPRGAQAGPLRVADLMTPAIFSVPPETTLSRVAEQMVALNVHRLFVVDSNGVLVGVISALDLLANLVP